MHVVHLAILRDCGACRVFDKTWYFGSEETAWSLCDSIMTKYDLKPHPADNIFGTYTGVVDGAGVIVTSKYYDEVEWSELGDIVANLPDLV